MTSVGITGGIGSGKSVVAELFRLLGVPVYIADEESKKLVHHSPVIQKQLSDLLGQDIYTEEGLNKKRLASYIFNDPDLLKQVNAIIHPEVKRDFRAWVTRLSAKVCAIESAILFESGFDREVDICLMVYAPLEMRIERALARDKSSCEETARRISNQMPDEQKKSRSDYVIYNDNRCALIPQVHNFLSGI